MALSGNHSSGPVPIVNEAGKLYFPATGLGYMKRQSMRAEGLLDCKRRRWGCVLQTLVWEKAKEENEHPLSQDRGFLGPAGNSEQQHHVLQVKNQAAVNDVSGNFVQLVSNQQAVRNEWSTKRVQKGSAISCKIWHSLLLKKEQWNPKWQVLARQNTIYSGLQLITCSIVGHYAAGR